MYSYRTRSKKMLGDMHTPVSIYLKVRDLYPQSVLMESSDYHAGENSLSFIALCPLASINVNNDRVTEVFPDNSQTVTPYGAYGNLSAAFQHFISRFNVEGEYADVWLIWLYNIQCREVL